MKSMITKVLGAAAVATSSTACATEPPMAGYPASYIEMQAADGETSALAEFLTGAAPIVKDTEPGTELWFALQAPGGKLAIFDVFVDEDARIAHFNGAVAGALKDNSVRLVDGGWEDGVLGNVYNSTVLSAKGPVDLYSATTATYIKLRAAPGQAENLAELLTAAGPIVSETEPGTLFWVALRIDEDDFAIFDIFADETGRTAHFAGEVAGLLNERSSVLVDGGWDAGVVANVTNFNILAIK
ncbi:MAG: hypothetical protein SXU28_04905 [Pseudomonadota bacterium]|nr:hypothetical protein [Pseudomonadota bacterium]